MTEAETEAEGSAGLPAVPGHGQESFPVSTLGQADGSPGQGLAVPPPPSH